MNCIFVFSLNKLNRKEEEEEEEGTTGPWEEPGALGENTGSWVSLRPSASGSWGREAWGLHRHTVPW